MIRRSNCRILHSQITPLIRVSSAAIWYGPTYFSSNGYYQFETWCFSEDKRQRSFQIIHGTHYRIDAAWIIDAVKIHQHIKRNLTDKFCHPSNLA